MPGRGCQIESMFAESLKLGCCEVDVTFLKKLGESLDFDRSSSVGSSMTMGTSGLQRLLDVVGKFALINGVVVAMTVRIFYLG